METRLGSVQQYGRRQDWPPDAVYIGNQWRGSRERGIDDKESTFGKPWDFHHVPNWQRLYLDDLIRRLRTEKGFEEQVRALSGKLLLCWCVSKQAWRREEVPCHGRILIEFVEMLNS